MDPTSTAGGATLTQQVQTSVLRSALDQQQSQARQLVQGIEASSPTATQDTRATSPATPGQSVGGRIDTSA